MFAYIIYKVTQRFPKDELKNIDQIPEKQTHGSLYPGHHGPFFPTNWEKNPKDLFVISLSFDIHQIDWFLFLSCSCCMVTLLGSWKLTEDSEFVTIQLVYNLFQRQQTQLLIDI